MIGNGYFGFPQWLYWTQIGLSPSSSKAFVCKSVGVAVTVKLSFGLIGVVTVLRVRLARWRRRSGRPLRPSRPFPPRRVKSEFYVPLMAESMDRELLLWVQAV